METEIKMRESKTLRQVSTGWVWGKQFGGPTLTKYHCVRSEEGNQYSSPALIL